MPYIGVRLKTNGVKVAKDRLHIVLMKTVRVLMEDNPATREFFSMTSNDKTEVIRLGLDVRKAAMASFQKWNAR